MTAPPLLGVERETAAFHARKIWQERRKRKLFPYVPQHHGPIRHHPPSPAYLRRTATNRWAAANAEGSAEIRI